MLLQSKNHLRGFLEKGPYMKSRKNTPVAVICMMDSLIKPNTCVRILFCLILIIQPDPYILFDDQSPGDNLFQKWFNLVDLFLRIDNLYHYRKVG